MLKRPHFIVLLLIGLIVLAVVLNLSKKENDDVVESTPEPQEISIGFYNVENLFDIYDDPDTFDDEFLPTAEREWTQERYEDKVVKLSTVISKLGTSLPAIVGLCEVENREVMVDLTQSDPLKPGKYDVVHYDSPDQRGIDVGLIYRTEKFTVTHSEPIPVSLPDSIRPTRDILYVKGTVTQGPELHIFVNHWPSRWGGAEQSEYKRVAAAKTLKTVIDSIMQVEPQAYILSMGDYNDYPYNVSVTEVLDADSLNSSSTLVNLMSGLEETHRGSFNYQGEWGFLDQIIVSRTLTDVELPDIVTSGTMPYFFDDMVYVHPQYGDVKPNRSYGGTKYYGGYSDHLPVYTVLKY